MNIYDQEGERKKREDAEVKRLNELAREYVRTETRGIGARPITSTTATYYYYHTGTTSN